MIKKAPIIRQLLEFENDDLPSWYLDEAECRKFKHDLLKYASKNRRTFVRFVHNLNIAESECLELIYETLSEATEEWGDFLVDEHERYFDLAELNEEYLEDLSNLIDIDLTGSELHAGKIIELLTGKINHPHEEIRYNSLWLIDDYLNVDNIRKYAKTLELILTKLEDEKREVRLEAERVLNNLNRLPQNYKPKFKDLFYRKLKIWQKAKLDKHIEKILSESK